MKLILSWIIWMACLSQMTPQWFFKKIFKILVSNLKCSRIITTRLWNTWFPYRLEKDRHVQCPHRHGPIEFEVIAKAPFELAVTTNSRPSEVLVQEMLWPERKIWDQTIESWLWGLPKVACQWARDCRCIQTIPVFDGWFSRVCFQATPFAFKVLVNKFWH